MRLFLIVQKHQFAALLDWNAAAWASGNPRHLAAWTHGAIYAHRLAASAVELLR